MIVAEVDSMHGNVENNSKKSKKRKARALEDGHDNGVNGRRNETVDEIVDVSLQMEINQKQRKNKKKLELNEEADFTNAQTKMSSNLSREDEKKRKKKHKCDSKHDEARVLRGSLEVNSSLQEKQLKNNDLGGESNAYSTPSNSQVTVDKKDEKSKKRKKKKKAKSLEEKKIDDNDVDVTSNSQVNSSLQEKQLENNDLDGESNAHSTPSNSQVTVDKKDEKSKKMKKAKSVEEKQLENIDVDGESNAYSIPSNSQVTVDKKDEKSKKKKKKKKKKKAKSVEEKKINDNDVDGESNANSTRSKSHDGKKRKKSKLVDNGSENPKSKGRSKRVSFSGHVEVFPSSDTDTERGAAQNDGVVQGKRFTREEDEIIKKAIEKYIEEHGLGEEGLNMILHCKDHREVRFCWREIGAAIPYRPKDAIYYRAHLLYERSERREWTEEEIATLKELHKKYGNSWKMAAKELGKSRIHLKDKWRAIKSVWNKGHWSQAEYQKLYDLVNTDLQMRAVAEVRRSKHGMIRDDIPWTAISDNLSTRSSPNCCMKWYNQLSSSMVADGVWSDTDDYRLVRALYELDSTCREDVDWDNLLEHRDGDVCRRRWGQMVLHIGHHGSKPFAEQVEILAGTQSPKLSHHTQSPRRPTMTRYALLLLILALSIVAIVHSRNHPDDFIRLPSHKLAGDDDSVGTRWAVLLAGSNGYWNYRHQADVCHAYQILRKGGIQEENIIVFMYDDIAYDEENPRPGVIINSPHGEDVYKGVPKDYTGDDVTADNFYAVLLGNKAAVKGGSGKVVDSGPNDHIFIYYTDHGGPGVLGMPAGPYIYANDLVDVLKKKHAAGTYKSLVFYLEACESGSIFEGLLPEGLNIYATTASGPDESSWGTYCPGEYPSPPPEYDTCLGDLYSVAWMEDCDIHNLRTETLRQQYELVKRRTSNDNSAYGSHVMQYGDLKLSVENLYSYLGTNPANDNFTYVDDNALRPSSKAINQRDADLLHFWHKYRKAAEGSARKLKAQKDFTEAMSHRMHIDSSIKLIGKLLFGIDKGSEILDTVRPTGQPLVDDWACLKSMVRTYETHCGSLSQYGMKHMRSIANFCNAGIRAEQMSEASSQACITFPSNAWSSLQRGFSA